MTTMAEPNQYLLVYTMSLIQSLIAKEDFKELYSTLQFYIKCEKTPDIVVIAALRASYTARSKIPNYDRLIELASKRIHPDLLRGLFQRPK